MNSLKADMYKFYWEKRGVLPSLLIGLLILLFSLFFKSSNEDETAFRVLISNVSGFIPLLFISTNLFFWGEIIVSVRLIFSSQKKNNDGSYFYIKLWEPFVCLSYM